MDNIIYSTETNRYAVYEKAARSKYERRCIDGTTTGSNKCCGYCQYAEHPGFLTTKQRREHDCLGKSCFYYVPKPAKDRLAHPQSRENDILEIANRAFLKHDGMKIIRAKEMNATSWVLSYVTLFSDVAYTSAIEQITKKTGCNIELERLNYDFDTCLKIIYA